MRTTSVVEDFNVLEDVAARGVACWKDVILTSLSVAKKLSATALSQQLPLRLML